jgi:hypothetical protein
MAIAEGLLQGDDDFYKGDGIQANNTDQNTSRAPNKQTPERDRKAGPVRKLRRLYVQIIRPTIGIQTQGD